MANERHSGPAVGDGSFDAYYYANCCGKPYLRNDEWLAFFGGFADRIVRDIGPKTVLDAGCALGLLVEGFRDRGVEAFGVDLSSYAIGLVHEKLRPYCRQGSVADEFGQDYDLIVCIEVVEHMPPREAEAAIANVCRHTNDVLFSSSPVDYREPTHVNVHPPEHWAEQFARHGFYRDVDYDASFITAWAARFRRRSDPASRIVRDYERQYWELLKAASDARGYSTQVQNELAQARERIASLEGALEPTVQALQQTREGLDAERRRYDGQQGHLERTVQALWETQTARAQAEDRLVHMEQSWFWKARGLWVALRGLFGAARR